MNPLLQQFLTEGRDFLEQISQNLLALEVVPDDKALIDDIFRHVHTLKGNSGLFDLPVLTRVIHAAEDLLDRVRDGEIIIDAELTDELLSAMDFVARLLDEVESSGTIPESYAAPALDLVEELRSRLPARDGVSFVESPIATLPEPDSWHWVARLTEQSLVDAFDQAKGEGFIRALRYVPEPECFFKGEDPILLLRNLPGLTGFSIRPAAAWPPIGELDVYKTNLLIDALSITTDADLSDHIKYFPEQVVLYRLPLWALAMPQGDADDSTGVFPDFVERAGVSLAQGDMVSFRSAIDAMLDIVGPNLVTASGLRWCRRLIDAGCEIAVLSVLFDAISKQSVPDWFAFHQLKGSQIASPTGPEGGHLSALDADDARMWSELLATQRQALSMKIPASQWNGRLDAVSNALGGLLHSIGDRPSLQSLEVARNASREAHDFTPLIAFIDNVTRKEPATRDIGEDVKGVTRETASVIAFPVPVIAQQAERIEAEAVVEDVRRTADGQVDRGHVDRGHVDRGMRVLKVPQEKVDRLMDLIGEMVVAKNALPYLAGRAEDHFGSRELGREIKAQYGIINRIAEEMQDGIMQVRMLPVGAVFQRFPRLVRDVAKQLGKKVRLVVEGEETEADKSIVESLADPMIHILRNSLDHGLELPEARIAAGKSEEGRLTVHASQEGDRVVIEIQDDGKGIDPAIIKRKAFEKGLIDEARLESITDADAVQLVFAPGFSTAETVSNLSGRGVGMDVVKSSIDRIGGQVRLTSELGRGTRIVLSLPLSMSVSHIMMVDIGGQRFGVPMDVVVETVRVPKDDIHTFRQRRTALLRGRIVPLYGSDELLQVQDPPKPNEDGEFAVLVTRINGETVGIIVDGFAQTIDVILKPLEGPLAGLGGFAGSALLGDGSVLLVLNLKELI